MSIVVVNMKDYIFADAIVQVFAGDTESDFIVERVYTPEEIHQYSRIATVVLMETTEFAPAYSFESRMKIREQLKKENPDCKIVLIVDENSEKNLADRVVDAKRRGQIDNFVFGTVSAAYLKAVLRSL